METDHNNKLTELNLDALVTVLKLANQNMSQLIVQMITRFAAQSATLTSLGIIASTAGGTQVKIGSGHLISVSVTTNSTGPVGTIYDSDTVTGVGSSVAMVVIPSSGFINYGFPFFDGLVVQPSTSNGTVVSVSYT